MALQLRRGLSSEVAQIVPADGEPIYVTDNQALVIGDGATFGGNVVSANLRNLVINQLVEDGHNVTQLHDQYTTGTIRLSNLTNANSVTVGPDATEIVGNVKLDNIGFQGSWIRNKDTGDIYISPQDGNTGVYFPSDTSAGDSAVELFNLDATGSVRIDAHNKNWVFGSDGGITFPDSTVQTTAYTGGGGGSTSTYYNLTVTNVLAVGPLDGQGELLIYRDGTNGHIISNTDPGNDYLTIASQRWLFLNPAEAVIVNENDPANSLLRVNKITPAGTYTEVIVDGNTSVTGNLTVGTLKVDQYADITTNGANSIDLYTNNFEADGVEVWLKHNDQVQINTANGVYSWQFKNDGNLSVPGNIDGSEGAVASMTGFRAGWYGGTGGYSFKNDSGQDTGMYSWGDGDLRLRANGDDVVQMTNSQAQFNKQIILNGVDIVGGSYQGNSLSLPVGGGATITSGYEGGVTLRSSVDNTNFATFNLNADGGLTLNDTTNTKLTIKVNNNERTAPNGNWSNNAGNMLIKPRQSGALLFGMKLPNGNENTVAITRGGVIALTNGHIGNTYPAGITMGSDDGGPAIINGFYDDGSTVANFSSVLADPTPETGGVTLFVDNYDYATDTDRSFTFKLGLDGAITLPAINNSITQINFDAVNGNNVTLATSGTVSFDSFSGEILINDLYDGYMYKFLVGGGFIQLIGTTNPNWTPLWVAATNTFSIADYIQMDYSGGYLFTNLASERTYNIFAIRTRNGA